ncbi:MAG: alpha/beta fold hydrolase, partial [Myxococcales bacterium]|nr:alpha/beta fold hydrolase [Myxococcales bacterium]
MPPRPESRPLPALIAAALLLGGCAEKPDQEDSSTETDATTATASDATATTAGSDAAITDAEDTEADCVTPAREAAVVIDNGVGELAGTMLIPEGCAPFPVVVIHAGSGPTDRNGNSPLLAGQNDSLKQLAEALQARGIATVRYDKRGVGESVGALQRDVTALRFEDYARDLELWIDAVGGDATFGEVTALGHSEGALIATVAAASTPPDRLISLAGAGRPAPEVLREQLTASLPEDLLAEALAILD